MVIINVSNSKENAMLNTVRVLRRLLRNAFFVTKRVNVISELQREPEAGRRRQARPSPPRIDEEPRYPQPARAHFWHAQDACWRERPSSRSIFFPTSSHPTPDTRTSSALTR